MPSKNILSLSAATLKNFPFTILCVVLIFILSFFTPPHTPLDKVAFIDKWTHLVMYGGTVGVYWLEYWHAHLRRKLTLSHKQLFVIAFVAPVLLGGLIEILQAYCTNGRRSGEWLDWVADSIGIIIAYALGVTLLKHIARKVWK